MIIAWRASKLQNYCWSNNSWTCQTKEGLYISKFPTKQYSGYWNKYVWLFSTHDIGIIRSKEEPSWHMFHQLCTIIKTFRLIISTNLKYICTTTQQQIDKTRSNGASYNNWIVEWKKLEVNVESSGKVHLEDFFTRNSNWISKEYWAEAKKDYLTANRRQQFKMF